MNADGTGVAQITDLDYDIFDPQFAPNGKTIYFLISTGGEAVSLFGGTAVNLRTISPDGKKPAYSTLDPATQKIVVRIRPVDRNRTEKVFNKLPGMVKGRRGALFRPDSGRRKKYLRQTLSETAPQRITDFDERQNLKPSGQAEVQFSLSCGIPMVFTNFRKRGSERMPS